jgi:hypothetical protein
MQMHKCVHQDMEIKTETEHLEHLREIELKQKTKDTTRQHHLNAQAEIGQGPYRPGQRLDRGGRREYGSFAKKKKKKKKK